MRKILGRLLHRQVAYVAVLTVEYEHRNALGREIGKQHVTRRNDYRFPRNWTRDQALDFMYADMADKGGFPPGYVTLFLYFERQEI